MRDGGQAEPGALRLDDALHARAWLTRHAQSALAALGRLSRAPLATFMTVAVIGIAFALPAALALTLDNLAQVGDRWRGGATLSVFLTAAADAPAAGRLAAELGLRREVTRVTTTSPDMALAEYRELGGDASVLRVLGEANPLPWTLVVHVDEDSAAPAVMEALASELGQHANVEQVEYDLRWVNRLLAITALGQRAAWVLALVLALAVLLVVGNTIRVEIEHRRDEIEVLHVVGATDAFIRRPFLYTGAWYGLLGGVFAASLIAAALAALEGPALALAAAYGSALRLLWPDALAVAALIGGGAALGLLGAWVAVGRYLAREGDLGGRDL